MTARQKAAQSGRREKQQRLEQAIAQLPELKQKQAEAEKRAGQGKHGQKVRGAATAGEHDGCQKRGG